MIATLKKIYYFYAVIIYCIVKKYICTGKHWQRNTNKFISMSAFYKK